MQNLDNEYRGLYNATTFRDYLNKTFIVIAIGLLISAGFALIASFLFRMIPAGMILGAVIVSVLAELGIAVFFSARLTKMEKQTAWLCYFIYCMVTGISLSFLLLAYTATSVVMAFVSTAVLFGCMAIIGYTTKVDLRKFGNLFFVGLLAIIIITLVNAFLIRSDMLSLLVCYLGILIFLGLIAFDLQKLRDLYNSGLADSTMAEKLLVYGAFELYLDFINLFIRLLQIFGRRRD